MKEFRKENNKLICEECGKSFVNINGLAQHVNCYHNIKKYFDKWIKEENDDKCSECGKITKFNGLRGYNNQCSKKCAVIIRQQHLEENNLKKYGVKNTFQRTDIKEKCKQIHLKNLGVENPRQSKIIQEKAKKTCLEKYGDENYNNTKKNKETKKERYGDENYVNIEKRKETNKEKYGNECYMASKVGKEKIKEILQEKYGMKNAFQAKEIKEKCKQTKKEKYGNEKFTNREKSKQTCLEKYGVENPSQNKDILEKQQKAMFKLKKYKDADIWYQCSLELDFLEKYYEKYPCIQRGPSIKYQFEGKNKVYHSDFYIPSLNLIIECKNLWLAKRDKEIIEAKEKATIANGFNYIMIVDKDYSMLEN